MPPKEQSNQADQGLDSRTSAASFLAIVSPCSTCKNRRSKQDKDGKPACPRMAHIQRQNDAVQNGTDYTQYAHLTLTGLEYNGFATPQPGVLVNPVYDDGRGSVYIWIARLLDNHGLLDDQGTLTVPPITDPSFLDNSTDYIQCSLLPVVPADTLATYFQKGRFEEGDTVTVTSFKGQHIDAAQCDILIEGMAAKLTLHSFFPVQARPKKDDHPRGA